MEKTRNKTSGFSRLTLLVLFLSAFKTGSAQKLQTIKGFCGIYYHSMDDLFKQRQAELDFYQFRPGQVVASIGAQCCHWEAVYAAASDSLDFYLQDIDTTFFNQRQAAFAWHYYDSLRGKPMTSSYTMVLGNEVATGLPGETFDKILIINSFHEFTAKEIMLADISLKLRPGGILYIDESVPRKPGELHGICKKPMLSPEEMIRILAENGFDPAGSLNISFRKGKTSRTIYAFKKKASTG